MSFQQKKKRAGLKQSDGWLCWLHTTSHCRERDGDGSAEVSVCAVAAVWLFCRSFWRGGQRSWPVQDQGHVRLLVMISTLGRSRHLQDIWIPRTKNKIGMHQIVPRPCGCHSVVHCAAYLKEQARGVRCRAVCWLLCGKPPHDGSIVTSFTV